MPQKPTNLEHKHSKWFFQKEQRYDNTTTHLEMNKKIPSVKMWKEIEQQQQQMEEEEKNDRNANRRQSSFLFFFAICFSWSHISAMESERHRVCVKERERKSAVCDHSPAL